MYSRVRTIDFWFNLISRSRISFFLLILNIKNFYHYKVLACYNMYRAKKIHYSKCLLRLGIEYCFAEVFIL